jgi:hypothetical protein
MNIICLHTDQKLKILIKIMQIVVVVDARNSAKFFGEFSMGI